MTPLSSWVGGGLGGSLCCTRPPWRVGQSTKTHKRGLEFTCGLVRQYDNASHEVRTAQRSRNVL